MSRSRNAGWNPRWGAKLLVGVVSAVVGVLVSVPASTTTTRGLPALELGDEPTDVNVIVEIPLTAERARAASGKLDPSIHFAKPGAPARRLHPDPQGINAAGLRIKTSRASASEEGSEMQRSIRDRLREHQEKTAQGLADRRR